MKDQVGMVNQQQQQMMMSMNPHIQQLQMQHQPPPTMNRSYGIWMPTMAADQMKYQNSQGFSAGGKQSKHLGPRSNWKGKKVNKNDRRMADSGRRKDKSLMTSGYMTGDGNGGGFGGYNPPPLNELQYQNKVKARRFFPKKKFYHNNANNNKGAPFAPRNTSSYIIRAKKSGGIASLVSPCPATPAVLPTPSFSPAREVLVDMAKEEWGVDGYGSMNGLIRLRSPGHDMEVNEEEEEEEGGGSSESDVEEHVEVERRLDHDLSRFEMIYPNNSNVLENRVDDQDSHIAQLEEENLILKERLFLMEREFGDLKRRLQSLERQGCGYEEINEEVVENFSEGSGSHGESHFADENNVECIEQNKEEVDGDVNVKEDNTNNGNIESAQEKKVEKGNEEFNPTLVDEPPKTEIIAQVNEDNRRNSEPSDNACVGDETIDKASRPDVEPVVLANTEDEKLGNE